MSELSHLSQREIQILDMLLEGCQNKEIALELGISISTVEKHFVNIFRKLDVSNRTEAAISYTKLRDD